MGHVGHMGHVARSCLDLDPAPTTKINRELSATVAYQKRIFSLHCHDASLFCQCHNRGAIGRGKLDLEPSQLMDIRHSNWAKFK